MKKIIPLCLLAIVMMTHIQAIAQRKSPILNHIAVYVYDLEKTTAFYRDVLQIDTIPEPFHDGKHSWFRIGEHSQMHLIRGAAAVTTHDKNGHLCFSVPSMAAFIDRLHANKVPFESWQGVKDVANKRVDGVQQVYFKDPEGNWIEVNDDKY
ncbi:VOC family protein [Chitinophaga sp. LS1]|uniref:VOC family protein n=1 Tax=Chitinophaga sp. LS1 TaxID=3051176 RepID=UPI002AAB257D|nr:VOC family protein [Chitinophaga sp. LS1]WPV64913.1 VOC family protein [Chitinophaga sp. LS1]